VQRKNCKSVERQSQHIGVFPEQYELAAGHNAEGVAFAFPRIHRQARGCQHTSGQGGQEGDEPDDISASRFSAGGTSRSAEQISKL